MKQIEFPGYETVVANSIWAKDNFSEHAKKTEVLHLERYTLPSKKDVVEFIISSLQSPDSRKVKGRSFSPLLPGFPSEEKQKLVKKDATAVKRLEECFDSCAGSSSSNENYLSVIYGKIEHLPVDYLRSALSSQEQQDVYLSFMMTRAPDFGAFLFRLENGEMPAKSDIDFLVSKKVTGSYPFSADTRGSMGYAHIQEYVNMVYESLKNGGLASVVDKSDFYKLGIASQTFNIYSADIAQSILMKAIQSAHESGQLAQLGLEPGSKPGPSGGVGPLGDYNPFSRGPQRPS